MGKNFLDLDIHDISTVCDLGFVLIDLAELGRQVFSVCFKVCKLWLWGVGGPSEECRDMSPEEAAIRRGMIDSDNAF